MEKIKENIPRHEIDELHLILTKLTTTISPYLFGTICGSYRRETQKSNDVDFIIAHTEIITKEDLINNKYNYLHKFIKLLKDSHILIDSLTGDTVTTKYMGIFKIKDELRRIDIRYVPYESFYSAILYFTGSKDFNKKMRQIAIQNNYILNEYGLFYENDKMVKVNSEKDIFDTLGMEYLEPKLRI